MLYTDSDIISADSLAGIDSEVTSVASAAKPAIMIEGSGSICEQAWQECGRQILQSQQMYSSYLTQPGMSGGHVAAVLNTGVPARTQSRVRLNQIVAHDPNYASMDSQLQHWMQYYALFLLYRDASSRMGKDRYEEKMERYQKAYQQEWRGLRNEGLPFVWQPLDAPGSKHGSKAGTWSAANLSSSPGPGMIGGSFQVALSYYDGSRYQSQAANGNAESAPSVTLSITIPADYVLSVDITSLHPPNGQMENVGLSQGAYSPLNASHWNLWVGSQDGPLYLQQEGIPITTRQAVLSGDPVGSGSTVGRGQWADLNLCFQNLVMRG